MKKTLLGIAGIVVLTTVAGIAATTGLTTQQIRTAVPVPINLSGIPADAGTSLSVAPADHSHSITGVLPIVNGGTGTTTGTSFVILPVQDGGTGNANIYGTANTWSVAQTFNDSGGIAVTATGAAFGVKAYGGAAAVYGIGTGGSGIGGVFSGSGSGLGLDVGGGATGIGIGANGGSVSGDAIQATANGSGANGITATSISGYGGSFLGGGTHAGVIATGGGGGPGVIATAGGGGVGIIAYGDVGIAAGVFNGGIISNSDGGVGAILHGAPGVNPPLILVAQTQPSNVGTGTIYVDSTLKSLMVGATGPGYRRTPVGIQATFSSATSQIFTVESGSVGCVCNSTAHTYLGQCAISSTTATITSSTSNSDVWSCIYW